MMMTMMIDDDEEDDDDTDDDITPLASQGVDPSQWSTYRGDMLEKFRDTYRLTWGQRDVAAVLAVVSD
jgi:hypothetical protein